MLALGFEVPYCTREKRQGSGAGQAASRAAGSPQPYGTDLRSAGNYSSDISREKAGVPGLAGLFAASREARQFMSSAGKKKRVQEEKQQHR